jgi:dTDP-4-amino-4,6-dideoxygalactose transaminase
MTTSLRTPTLAMQGGTPLRAKPWPPRAMFTQADRDAVLAVMDRAIQTGQPFGYEGDHEQAYCAAFARALGGGYADAVNSGTNAVYVALRALNPPPYSEVIVPALSDNGGLMPPALLNCIPIPADTQPHSHNIGAAQIAQRLTPRTSVVIVAHIGGQPADMDPILDLARQHNLLVLEDCAQAHGAIYKGRPVGTLGDIAAFSTMSGKHHATGAQGGVVYCRDEERYWHVRRIADRGKPFNLEDDQNNVLASLNFNQNELACAIGVAQLRRLPQIVAARRQIAHAIARRCADLPGLRVVVDDPQTESSFWFLLVEVDPARFSVCAQTLGQALRAEGIGAIPRYDVRGCQETWYRQRQVFGRPGLPWTSPEYRGDPDAQYPTPNADARVQQCFRINIHEGCGAQEIDDVASALAKVSSAFLKY